MLGQSRSNSKPALLRLVHLLDLPIQGLLILLLSRIPALHFVGYLAFARSAMVYEGSTVLDCFSTSICDRYPRPMGYLVGQSERIAAVGQCSRRTELHGVPQRSNLRPSVTV